MYDNHIANFQFLDGDFALFFTPAHDGRIGRQLGQRLDGPPGAAHRVVLFVKTSLSPELCTILQSVHQI